LRPRGTRAIGGQQAARAVRLLVTTRIEPMTSSALNTKNATSSQSTSTPCLPPADPCTAQHAAHPTDQRPDAIAAAAIMMAPREYGISFFHPMFRIWSIRTRGTDQEIQMNTTEMR